MIKHVISRLQLARDDIRHWFGLRLFDRPKPVPDLVRPIINILIVRWDAKWGDAIVSSFFIPEIKKKYPEANVTVLAPANMVDYFSAYLGADKVLALPKRLKYRQLRLMAKELGHFDLTVHLSPRLKMKDLYFFSRLDSDCIAGMDDEVQSVNIKLGKQSAGQHYSTIYKNLLLQLGIDFPDGQYLVPRDLDSQERIKYFLAEIVTPLLIISPYGSGHSRQLNAASIRQLIAAINRLKPELTLCILLTPDKRDEVAEICAEFDNVICYKDTKSIYDSIEIVAQADWVVSVDTAIVHIATGLKKTTLALYNPDIENFERWHPNNERSLVCNAMKEVVPDINKLIWSDVDNKLKELFFSVELNRKLNSVRENPC